MITHSMVCFAQGGDEKSGSLHGIGRQEIHKLKQLFIFYGNYQSGLISVTLLPSLCVWQFYLFSIIRKQTGLWGQACIITLVVISSNVIWPRRQAAALLVEVQSINEAGIQAGIQVSVRNGSPASN